MDLKFIETFVCVAKEGSFVAAARRQNRDPSQVSRAIATLETYLQVTLFQRTTRHLALTEAGERYLHRITPALEELGVAAEEARNLSKVPQGTLKMTTSTSFGQVCLIPKLGDFYKKYPEIDLDLAFTDRNLNLVAENMDLACRLSPTFQSDLIGIKLFDTRYRVCATPSYLEKAEPISIPEHLSAHGCTALNLSRYDSAWHFMRNGKKQEIKITPRVVVSNALSLKECLLMNMGPGLIADWLIEKELNDGSLVDIFPSYSITATDFNTAAWLLYPRKQYLPQKTRVMIDFLKSKLQK